MGSPQAPAEVRNPVVDRVTVQAGPVQALAALLGGAPDAHAQGALVPPLWHWAALATWPDASSTGPDGHPRRAQILPGLDTPRRMFAGGRVEVLGPLRVGDAVQRQVRVVSAERKSGRQGEFVLVRVETVLTDVRTRAVAIREVQELVYRAAAAEVASTPVRSGAASLVGALLQVENDGWSFRTDPTLLLRFSAATANGHRIHYDHPYATQVEGYPDLVVHGPLITLALAEAAQRSGRLAGATTYTHRALRPLFCGQDGRVVLSDSDATVRAAMCTAAGEHSVLTAA